MDLDAYLAERRGEWNRLETLAARRKLSATESDELVLLYQRAATHLSVVRSRTPDPVVLADLSRLVLAGRAAVTRGNRFSLRPVADFVLYRYPAALYRTRRWWATLGILMMVLGAALTWYVAVHPDVIALLLSDGEVQQLVGTDFVGYYSEFQAQNFALQVWTNNALLTAQCLASGVLILPVLYLVGVNLLNTGLTGGVMFEQDAGGTFLTYLAPHGCLELTCLFIGAGVGLRIGWAWISPGPTLSRRESLVAWVREGMVIAIGLVPTLAVAGILEAFVTPSALPAPVRIAIGVIVWLAFLAYAIGRGGWAALETDRNRSR
ncbi:stage II sporulation protein M [Actinoplanes sp. NPDC051851]|uniref:stage II sporulation protein M n=1 Tax=Actinoplanes sp. NPDC051851 TaxID=3154753 RepID=UPI00341C5945